MQAGAVNGWREVLARVFAGFEVEYGLTPEWLVNPGTNRRLKLDYFFPDIAFAVRLVGMEGTSRRQRKSDDELEADERREQARAAVCRDHGVVLVSIEPGAEPRVGLRNLEMGLARASALLAQSKRPQNHKQAFMPRLSDARRRVGEFTTCLTSPEKLNLYAEMWWDRQAALSEQAPAPAEPVRVPRYEVGMRVIHQRFGSGLVVSVARENGETKVTVEFDDATMRSFYASLVAGAKLEIVDDSDF